MTYSEMQKAEAAMQAALAPAKKQRGATKAQLAYRKHANALCVCGAPFAIHTHEQTYICAMNRS